MREERDRSNSVLIPNRNGRHAAKPIKDGEVGDVSAQLVGHAELNLP